ncbi:MAG: sodium-dependent bicarbonate transport family permease, partial [Methylotenera sp.]
MFFALGFVAQLIKSDLKLPVELTKSITIYLLLSVGIHGGIELSHATLLDAVPSIFTAIALGVLLPIIAYLIINKVGKIDHLNAVAIATHYGS